MYYSVNVDHKGMAAHITRNKCGRFKCCTSKGMDGTDDMLWKDSEEDGNVRSEFQEDEGTDCEHGDTDW
jgi:hypothetical protein